MYQGPHLVGPQVQYDMESSLPSADSRWRQEVLGRIELERGWDSAVPVEDLIVQMSDVLAINLVGCVFETRGRSPDFGRKPTVRDHCGKIRSRIILLN